MKKIVLPHGHLSWSGLNLWETSELEYVAKYILHQPQRTNSGLEYGKYIANGLEQKEEKDDEVIASLRSRLPAYAIREQPLDVEWRGIQLVARLDTYRPTDHAFREYKTGRRDQYGNPPWTPTKARSHGQLFFYAFMLWIKTKKIPPPAFLDWIETEVKEDGTVGLAENIQSFQVPFTTTSLIEMGARIEKAATAISKQYLKYLELCQ